MVTFGYQVQSLVCQQPMQTPAIHFGIESSPPLIPSLGNPSSPPNNEALTRVGAANASDARPKNDRRVVRVRIVISLSRLGVGLSLFTFAVPPERQLPPDYLASASHAASALKPPKCAAATAG